MSVIDAYIGRWDTPYPYPETGDYAPGLQPKGPSQFYIDIDVNDGGQMASFRYALQTYDASRWDWYDIIMITPDGTHKLVDRLGKPGSTYGTYWYSAPIYLAANIDTWRNQRVRFVFSVMQDGWVDQTQGQVLGFRVDSCPIPPLTPITDPEALRFEAANGSIFDNDPNRFHLGSELAFAWRLPSAMQEDHTPAYLLTAQQHISSIYKNCGMLGSF